jgi:hypothetical protein
MAYFAGPMNLYCVRTLDGVSTLPSGPSVVPWRKKYLYDINQDMLGG